mgnify:CR=1 FL=1
MQNTCFLLSLQAQLFYENIFSACETKKREPSKKENEYIKTKGYVSYSQSQQLWWGVVKEIFATINAQTGASLGALRNRCYKMSLLLVNSRLKNIKSIFYYPTAVHHHHHHHWNYLDDIIMEEINFHTRLRSLKINLLCKVCRALSFVSFSPSSFTVNSSHHWLLLGDIKAIFVATTEWYFREFFAPLPLIALSSF